ncbi:MAG: reverse transcriptase domain-containing protein [Methylotenera sp.]|nr:reverse transcriptase domain-containing protein [Methylotenera sp.]MDD4926685.1 reverse transcriptase domain-containing protein [Methylotenera sp.]
MSASIVFKSLFRKQRLIDIFSEHISGSTAVGLDRIRPIHFQKNLTSEVIGVCERINKGHYKFTSYKQKLISKGANNYPRVISIPTVRDRITLRAICDFLSQLYPHINTEIPQVKITSLKTALQSKIYNSFIKIDLSAFYTSIEQDILIKVLKRKIRKPEILNLITAAIQTPTVAVGKRTKKPNVNGVPQGLAISNILAEIFISDFDKKMLNLPNIYYQRYVDDILILCNNDTIDQIANIAYEELKKLNLKPHPLDGVDSKSHKGDLNKSFDYLGYTVEPNSKFPTSADSKIGVRNSTIRKFEASIAKIFTTYRYQLTHAETPDQKTRAERICEWRLNLRITGCIFEGKRLGWIFYFSQLNTSTPLRAVDSTIDSLMRRFSLTGKIKAKSLVKAFYETQRKNKTSHKYIPNFDHMSVVQKRKILTRFLVSSEIDHYSDERINYLFKLRIGAVVKELEQDLQNFS